MEDRVNPFKGDPDRTIVAYLTRERIYLPINLRNDQDGMITGGECWVRDRRYEILIRRDANNPKPYYALTGEGVYIVNATHSEEVWKMLLEVMMQYDGFWAKYSGKA